MNKTDPFIVALMGARMHYAVPRLLHQHEQLEHFYTDICATHGWPALLHPIPQCLLPSGLRRLMGRVPTGLPHSLVTAFTRFGLDYERRRSAARTISEMTTVHLWAGETFNRLIIESNPPLNTSLYCFNSAGLELLHAWNSRGQLTMLEQTIAPRRVEEKILREEELAFPGWQEPLPRDANVEAYMQREEQEWQAARVIVCGSEFVRNGVRECGGPVERCVVVPYGIALHDFPAWDRGSIKDRPLRVLTVGEVGLRKGSHYVLEAARQLAGRVEFRMAGPMGLLPERTSELRRHIDWVGIVPRQEIAAHYRWADVFLLPSLCEGSATATYEAFCAGLPVIATMSTGSLVEDGVNGFCVPERNALAIVQAIESFLHQPTLLHEMSAAAREIAQMISLDAYGDRLLAAARTGAANLTPHPQISSVFRPTANKQLSGIVFSNVSLSDVTMINVSAIVTAFEREQSLLDTLTRLESCVPPPAEILVHVDGGRNQIVKLVKTKFPKVKVLESTPRLGPGGARNRLIQQAANEWVASFDDDSRPWDDDYFSRVSQMASQFPDAAVLAAKITERGGVPLTSTRIEHVADFVGCGCVYRRAAFLETAGFVPLPVAYAMEEVDLAIRLCASGRRILLCHELHVFHDTDLTHRSQREITAASIANIALHSYLRYPAIFWLLGIAQCIRKVFSLIELGWTAGIWQGLRSIPCHLWRHRHLRNPISIQQFINYHRLQHSPETAITA